MRMSWKMKAVSSLALQHSLKVKLRSHLVFSVSRKTLAASICSRLVIYVVLVSVTGKCSEMSVGSDCELLLRRALLGPLHLKEMWPEHLKQDVSTAVFFFLHSQG